MPVHALEGCLTRLVDIGVLAEVDGAGPQYVPSMPFDTTTVAEVLESLSTYQPPDTYAPPRITEPNIEAIVHATRTSRSETLARLTLKQLALAGESRSDTEPLNADVAAM